MLKYAKRVIIFNEITTGYVLNNKKLRASCIVESKNQSTKAIFDFLTPINQNSLTIYISDSTKEIYKFKPLTNARFVLNLENLKIENGVTILFSYKNMPIFYGNNGNSYYNLTELINYAKKETNVINTQTNVDETIDEYEYEKTQNYISNGNNTSSNTANYNDELIATENYYKIENESNFIYNENVNQFTKNTQNGKEQNPQKTAYYNETDFCSFKEDEFYNKIKDKLHTLLTTHSEVCFFKDFFADSKFVKIKYSDNKYYYVGVLYNNGTIEYLCYAISGTYGEIPKEISNYFEFLPKSKFNLTGEGFYLIFQNAFTGEVCKKIT